MIVLPLLAVLVAGATYGLIFFLDDDVPPRKIVIVEESGESATGKISPTTKPGNARKSTAQKPVRASKRAKTTGRDQDIEQHVSKVPGPNDHESGEILVADASSAIRAALNAAGLVQLEEAVLDALDMRLARYAARAGVSVDDTLRTVAQQFPNLLTARNDYLFGAQDASAIPSFRRGSRTSGDTSRSKASPRRSSTSRTKADEFRGNSWVRQAIGWNGLAPRCGAGVRIGLADTPVALDHPALRGQKITSRSFHRKKRRPGPSAHGTAVAAILVGKPSNGGLGGLLPNANLWAANIFEINEKGRPVGNTFALIRAVNWLVKQDLHVLNLSVAGNANKILARAIKRLRKHHLIIVAAAGNWGSDTRPAYPAAYPDSIAVTAVDVRHNAYKRGNRGSYIDFAMPGVNVWTASSRGAKYQTGTSFSAPFITALVGLEVAADPNATVDVVRRRLAQTTIDLGRPGKDRVFGWGVVSAPPRCGA